MRPLELTLTGFKGIQAGMGLETFHIDLREHNAAQLVAIVAPNGRGKTTILDNMQPYRLMPSKIRGANYAPEAFSYFDHLVGPGDAAKTLVWEHKGTLYRSLLEWKLREKTQAASAYLQRQNAAGDWEPVTLPDGTSSDGKVKTYDRCVEGILGSPRLYFTAAFSAQGRSQLSSYGQGDIKGLMSEVLGLHRIQELGDKSAEVVKGLRGILSQKRERVQELDGLRTQANELQHAITVALSELNGTHLPAIESNRQTVNKEQVAVADMQREQQDAEDLRRRRQVVEQQITEAGAEHERAIAVVDADKTTSESQYTLELQRLSTSRMPINDTINRARLRITAADGVLALRQQIIDAIADTPRLRDALRDAETTLTTVQAKANEARQKRTELQQADKQLATMRDLGGRARAQETDLRTRCALTREVPCQGTDLQGRCKLLTESLGAEQKLPEVEADIARMTTEYRMAKEARDALETIAATIPALEADEKAAQTARTNAANALAAAESLAAKADSLAAAESAKEDAEKTIEAAELQLAAIAQQEAEAAQRQNERLNDLASRRAQAIIVNGAALERLKGDLDRIPVPGDDSALTAAQERLVAAEKAEQEARAAADRSRGTIAQAEGRLVGLEESISAGIALDAEVERLENEITHWSLLQKALGRDGILALSIDDAGPTLAGLANDLLLSCYGPRFSVRIDTQETVKSTGAQKETFDVIVFDSESDSSKSVADMSGGERIWINEALTRAIALYQAQSTGQTFHTLFSDESDGALDPEKKGQFVRMKRRVLELGGYSQEFFISHSPDVWPLADAVIHLGETH